MASFACELLSKYFLRKGDAFKDFWTSYQKGNRKILYVMGLDFDPRALSCFEIIFSNKSNSAIDCMVLEYDDNSDFNDLMSSSLKSNIADLEVLIPKNNWKIKNVKTRSSADYAMSVDLVTQLEKSEFSNYSDIVVDISSVPSGIYFPLIKTILDWINYDEAWGRKGAANLHVVAAENSEFDGQINAVGMNDRVTYMYKFSKNLESQAKIGLQKIWLPLLGENKLGQLDKIYQEISPKEVCPIFPSPSIDPYRTQRLLLIYREFLFDTLDIDTRNFIYSNEQNPFETFRQIYKTSMHYYDLFRELGGCNIVISPLSSKLLCLGSFLASYALLDEGLNIGVAHIENKTYTIDSLANFGDVKKNSVPFTLWLTGDVYEQ